MKKSKEYDWDEVLSAASRLQGVVLEAVLVGGTASALFAGHRTSYDADHVLPDLRNNFNEILSDLESVAGWQTARIKPPVMILGSLDGVETGVRQLIRSEPLETTELFAQGEKIVVPTEEEILRIKGALVLKRNATRDYLDFAALSKHLGEEGSVHALQSFDRLYPQKNGESALQQLYIQLADPNPFDLRESHLSTYKNLESKWHDWGTVVAQCQQTACAVINHFDRTLSLEARAEEIFREQNILVDPVNAYDSTVKNCLHEKQSQVEHIETALENRIGDQRELVRQTAANRPGPISSLWKGAAWKQEQQTRQARLETLERRLSRVKKLRQDGKRLEDFAVKKLRRNEPELTAKRDELLQKQRREAVAAQVKKQEQAREQSQSLGLNRVREIEL